MCGYGGASRGRCRSHHRLGRRKNRRQNRRGAYQNNNPQFIEMTDARSFPSNQPDNRDVEEVPSSPPTPSAPDRPAVNPLQSSSSNAAGSSSEHAKQGSSAPGSSADHARLGSSSNAPFDHPHRDEAKIPEDGDGRSRLPYFPPLSERTREAMEPLPSDQASDASEDSMDRPYSTPSPRVSTDGVSPRVASGGVEETKAEPWQRQRVGTVEIDGPRGPSTAPPNSPQRDISVSAESSENEPPRVRDRTASERHFEELRIDMSHARGPVAASSPDRPPNGSPEAGDERSTGGRPLSSTRGGFIKRLRGVKVGGRVSLRTASKPKKRWFLARLTKGMFGKAVKEEEFWLVGVLAWPIIVLRGVSVIIRIRAANSVQQRCTWDRYTCIWIISVWIISKTISIRISKIIKTRK